MCHLGGFYWLSNFKMKTLTGVLNKLGDLKRGGPILSYLHGIIIVVNYDDELHSDDNVPRKHMTTFFFTN